MNVHTLKVESVALYGSHARGDADIISDSDLLIVDSSPAVLSEASRILHSFGFSCATYTWQRLSHMSAHGSLFLQHLKDESLIIRDGNSQLERLLECFKPKHDYSCDVEATKQVVSLTECVSETKASIGWALDVLAVAVRNIGILEIANRGQYAFSLSTVFNKLVNFGILTRSDVQTLLPLRLYKTLYRSQSYQLLPGLGVLENIQRTISKRFRIDFGSRIVSQDTLVSDFLGKSEKHPDKYCRFRLLEGATVPYLEGISDLPPDSIRRFTNLIQNQNHYGLFCHDLSVPLRNAAMDIIMHKWTNQ